MSSFSTSKEGSGRKKTMLPAILQSTELSVPTKYTPLRNAVGNGDAMLTGFLLSQPLSQINYPRFGSCFNPDPRPNMGGGILKYSFNKKAQPLDDVIFSLSTGLCGARFCSKAAADICGGCGMVSYCSSACQKKAWKEEKHRLVCRELKTGSDRNADARSNIKKLRSWRLDKHSVEIFCAQYNKQFEPKCGKKQLRNDDWSETDYRDKKDWEWEYMELKCIMKKQKKKLDSGEMVKVEKPTVQAVWKRYPKRIEIELCEMYEFGAPYFIYRPGQPKADGHTKRNVDNEVVSNDTSANRRATFVDMMERDVCTGASRMIRVRGQPSPLPKVESSMGTMLQSCSETDKDILHQFQQQQCQHQ